MFLNVDRARDMMKEHRIDALIASTPENVTYLAGTVGWSGKVYVYSVHMFAVFSSNEGIPPALIVPAQEVTYVAAQQSWIKDLYTFGSKIAFVQPPGSVAQNPEEETFLGMMNDDTRREKSPAAALAQALRERGLVRALLALDQERVMPNVRRRLEETLPEATFVEASDLFRLIRMVKTPAELEALREAAALNERACTAASNAVAEGATELEVASVYRREVAGGGGMWQWFHFGSGRRSAAFSPPTEKKVRKGEMWKFDAGLTLNNFQADTGGGGVIGEPTKAQLNLWRASEAGFKAALGKVRAGALPSKIFRAALEGTRAGGVPEHNSSHAGHAIGLEAREVPYLLSDPFPVDSAFLPPTSDVPLEEGSTICVENPCQIFAFGGAQVEKTFIVTRNGYEPLLPQERKLRIVPA